MGCEDGALMLIEIYSDVVCPWCYIGKARLDRALAERPRVPVDVRWMPFQLNPDMPPDGMDRDMYIAVKFGSRERARQMHGVVEQAAARDGVPLRLDLIRRTPNTVNAHRLIRFADQAGRAGDMVSALFSAYFQQGHDIGDVQMLATLAGTVGLDSDAALDYLDSDTDRAAIRNSDAQARQLGVQAVPCFIFDRRYALSGAQEYTAFFPMLDLAG